jgi:hypothetical protein
VENRIRAGGVRANHLCFGETRNVSARAASRGDTVDIIAAFSIYFSCVLKSDESEKNVAGDMES